MELHKVQVIQTYKYLYFKLPVEIQRIINSYYDPEYGFHYDKIKEVEKEYQYKFGYVNWDGRPLDIYKFENTKRIIKCMEVIPLLFKKLKTYSKTCIGSYEGKHIVEKYQNEYISNNEFIMAMIMLGFKPQIHLDTENCEFKAAKNRDRIIFSYDK